METKGDDTDKKEPIPNLSGDYTWTLSETSKFTREVISRAGSDNTSVGSVTALESRIIGEPAVGVACRVIHNTKTPPDTESTDRFTTIGLA